MSSRLRFLALLGELVISARISSTCKYHDSVFWLAENNIKIIYAQRILEQVSKEHTILSGLAGGFTRAMVTPSDALCAGPATARMDPPPEHLAGNASLQYDWKKHITQLQAKSAIIKPGLGAGGEGKLSLRRMASAPAGDSSRLLLAFFGALASPACCFYWH